MANADEVSIQIEAYRGIYGYYPTAMEWNVYAVEHGLKTTPEILQQYHKRWNDLVPDSVLERSQKLHEHEKKSDLVKLAELRLLSLIEERLTFPYETVWNEIAMHDGLPTADALRNGQLDWWSLWEERYGLRLTDSEPFAIPDTPAYVLPVSRRRSTLTLEECVAALQAAAKDLGSSFSQKAYNTYAVQHDLPMFRKFSSLFLRTPKPWDAAMRQAGLSPARGRGEGEDPAGKEPPSAPDPAEQPLDLSKRMRIKTPEDCVAALKAAATFLGDTFSQQEYLALSQQHPGLPHPITLLKFFKEEDRPWSAAMRSAGLKAKRG